MNEKPLGKKAYGHIPHLPDSRMGPGDHHCHDGQAEICTNKKRDWRDQIIVQEKLDGSNCSVAKLADGKIVVLTRSGYEATTSKYEQHQYFDSWVRENIIRFDRMLLPGERVCGEWLAQAHGTIYKLHHEPFVVFDLIQGERRLTLSELIPRAYAHDFILPRLISYGNPIPIIDVIKQISISGHGAVDKVEGAVWRVERNGEVDFLAKFVRPDKKDGIYLESVTGNPPVWNWKP